MEEQVFTFMAQTGEENAWFWGGLILALGAGTATIILLKRSWKQKASAAKTLPAMLLFFIALSAAGSAIFSGAQLLRLKSIKMDNKGMYIAKHNIKWEDIAEIRIQTTESRNALNATAEDTRILIIRTQEGQNFFLSGKNYALPEILGRMKELRKME